MFTCIHVPTHYIGRIHPVVKDQNAPSRFKQESTMEDVSECHHIVVLERILPIFSMKTNLMAFEGQAACCEENHPPGRTSNNVLQSLPPLSPLLTFVRI